MPTHQKRGKSYKITVSCGYDIAGKQLRKHTTWTPPDGLSVRQLSKELARQKLLFEEKIRARQHVDGRLRFADFYQIWLRDYAKNNLKITSLNGYESAMKRVFPALGHLKLSEIKPSHLNEFYNNLQELDRNLDNSTILCYHKKISAILEQAVKWEIIQANPAKKANPPKPEKSRRGILTRSNHAILWKF